MKIGNLPLFSQQHTSSQLQENPINAIMPELKADPAWNDGGFFGKSSVAKLTESQPHAQPIRAGLFTMVRDVLVTSINKGQFPLAIIGLLLSVVIIKMPDNDVSKLVFLVRDDLIKGWLSGYVLFVFAVFGWAVHIKKQRNWWSEEMERVTAERNRLQSQVLGSPVKSSNA